MKVNEFFRPQTVEEALALLGEKPSAKLLAGGTDLVIALRERQSTADAIIDITGIGALREIREEGDTLHIGAAATFTEVQYSDLVRKYCPALCEAASQMGAVQVRNLATLGGNVANAATAADGIPPLLCMDAVAVVRSANAERILPVSEVVTGINKNSLAAGEMITQFRITAKPGCVKVFEKIGRRKALAISRINLAVCAAMSGKTVKRAAVAVGAVGKTAYRVNEVEAFLAGRELTEAVIAEATTLMDDIVARNLAGRSTTPYKRRIAGAVLKRALERIAGGEGV